MVWIIFMGRSRSRGHCLSSSSYENLSKSRRIHAGFTQVSRKISDRFKSEQFGVTSGKVII